MMGLRERVGSELLLSEPHDPAEVAAKLRIHFPHLAVESRCRFRLASNITSGLHTNTKKTTIRYTRNAVEYPISGCLPVFEDFGGTNLDLKPIGSVRIIGLHYKVFGALNDVDAARDGFETKDALKSALCNFYGSIEDTEVVSIYAICLEAETSDQAQF